MTKDELIIILRECTGDQERDHIVADNALISYIDDDDIREAFCAIEKWYA